MATEKSPLYDSLVGELGDPFPANPIDCSYQAMVALAAAGGSLPAEPVSLPAPPKRDGKAAAKQMVGAARESAAS